MRKMISAGAAKAGLADALRQVEGGDEVLITRYGKPVAVLVGAERLEQLSPPPAAAEATGAFERAVAASRRRIDLDLAKAPEALRPILQMIRRHLLHPGLTVTRIRRALGLGSHDVTTDFRRAVGVTIRQYLEDRRLDCVVRLLQDSDLEVETIAKKVGYSGRNVLSDALHRREGLRPRVYRAFAGELSRQAAEGAKSGLPPLTPRFVAGVVALAPEVGCGRCDEALEGEPRLRVFEDLAPLCDACAGRQAPELAALLGSERSGA